MADFKELTKDINQNINTLGAVIGIGQVFDIETRDIVVLKKRLTFFYASFLIDNNALVKILEGLLLLNIEQVNEEAKFKNIILNYFLNQSITLKKDIKQLSNHILSGDLVVLLEDSDEAIVADLRKYPSRSIGEPDNERVVRGSRDGFTENLANNLALIRRRVKTGKLRTKPYYIGTESETTVILMYIEGSVNEQIIKTVDKSLKAIDIKELTMSDKALEEILMNQKYSPYPLVRYTERPDTLAVHLFQGMFALLVDTSPSAILGPVSVFDHMQHAEEYRQTPLAGTYLRILRFLGIMASFLLMPLWFAIINNYQFLPDFFHGFFTGHSSRGIIFIQIIIAEVGIELLRMASIHTPNSLSTSMGLVAGILIGQIAIEVGLFTEVIVLLGAISAIGSYITPSYELSLANKIVKIVLIIVIYFFGIYGLIGGLIVIFLYLVSLKSFSRPYLYPLIPFNGKLLLRQIFRFPYQNKKTKD